MSDDEADWSSFRGGECWAAGCTVPPDGLLLNGAGLRVAVCEDHGEEYVVDGNWQRFEDLRGWVDRNVPGPKTSGE